jgi:hypothetical protein
MPTCLSLTMTQPTAGLGAVCPNARLASSSACRMYLRSSSVTAVYAKNQGYVSKAKAALHRCMHYLLMLLLLLPLCSGVLLVVGPALVRCKVGTYAV